MEQYACDIIWEGYQALTLIQMKIAGQYVNETITQAMQHEEPLQNNRSSQQTTRACVSNY